MKKSILNNQPNTENKRAFAIAVILVMLAALALLATGGLLTSRLDRASARNISHHTQARLAANDGVEAAKLRLMQALNSQDIPFHCAVEEIVSAPINDGFRADDKDSRFVFHALKSDSTDIKQSFVLRSGPDTLTSSDPTTLIELDNRDFYREAGTILLNNELITNQKTRHAFWIMDGSCRLDLSKHGEQTRDETTSTPGQIPIALHDGTVLNNFSKNNLLSAATMNLIPNLQDTSSNVVSPLTANNRAGDHIYSFKNSSVPLNPEGGPRLSLKLLRDFVETLSPIQSANNPRSRVVNGLLGLSGGYSPVNWGGGDFKFLLKRYTTLEAQNIVANIIDFLDSDIIPTTDLDVAPSYFGTEVEYHSNGIRGHPVIVSIGTGIILNRSSASSTFNQLNSTRLLATLGIVNPWDKATLNFGASYTIVLRIATIGTASSPNLRGPNAQTYFGTILDEVLTDYPVTSLPPNTGRAFPRPPSAGNSYATSLPQATFWNVPPYREPVGITFSGPGPSGQLIHKILECRIIYTPIGGPHAGGQFTVQSIVGPEIYAPQAVNANSGGSSLVFKAHNQPTRQDVFLANDLRLHHLQTSWIRLPGIESGVEPEIPQNTTLLSVYPGISPDFPDGRQGKLTADFGHDWWKKGLFTHTSKRFIYCRNDVGHIGDLGFIFSSRPWQTLSLTKRGQNTPSLKGKEDWRLLSYVISPGYLDTATVYNNFPSSGHVTRPTHSQINVNTKDIAAWSALFAQIPGWTPPSSPNGYKYLLSTLVTPLKNFSEIFDYLDDLYVTNIDTSNDSILDHLREIPAKAICDALTHNSRTFTIYSEGQALSGQNVVAKSTVKARIRVDFNPASINNKYTIKEIERQAL
jgi:hypothetical protein